LNRWFVVHDLLAYSQHSDMIGNVVKVSGVRQPRFSTFSEIKKGDLVVYYATKDSVVTGIFQVVSDIEYLPNDKHWKEIMVYRIESMETPPQGSYLDFRKLVNDPKTSFDMFPNKSKWGIYLQGKTCKLLTERDYLTIKNAFTKKEYLKSAKEIRVTPTKWHKEYGKKTSRPRVKAGRHQEAIEKWKFEEEKKFGLFKPDIKTNT